MSQFERRKIQGKEKPPEALLPFTITEERSLRKFINDFGSLKGLPNFTYICAQDGLREKGYKRETPLNVLFEESKDKSKPNFEIIRFSSGEKESPRFDRKLRPGEFSIEFYCSTGFQSLSGVGGEAKVTFGIEGDKLVLHHSKAGGVLMC